MKLKNYYLIRLAGVAVIIGAIFIAVVLNNDSVVIHKRDFNVIQLHYLYLLVGLYTGANGFIEIADLVKLGFGITRFSIFRKFTMTVVFVDIVMFLISFLFVGLSKLADSNLSILYYFDYRLIIYFSLIIYFLGQLGMFLGNIIIPDFVKLGLFTGFLILIAIAANLSNKFLINSLLIVFSVGLSIANFIIIRNIKLEINL